MSVMKVKEEVLKFLASPNHEVMCISGKWGTGKTYSWREYLTEAIGSGKIFTKRYSYVSLFGMNSLEEVKYAIFENTVKNESFSEDASIATLQDAINSAEAWGRKGAWLGNMIPGLKTYLATAAPAFFMVVRNQLVCIDDLERRGQKLDIGDVLGLVSLLKEQKKCKVIVLLNDEVLTGNDKQKLDNYLEKVADLFIKFNPTTDESINIALPGNDRVSTMMAKSCKNLNISNVRVIRRIERFVRLLEPMVENFHKGVFEQVVHSAVLFGWSKFQPESAPPLDYLLKRKRSGQSDGKNDPITPQEASWNALLDAYNFSAADEFDVIVLQGIHDGFFNEDAVTEAAAELEKSIMDAEAEGSNHKAWAKFRASFNDDQEEVLDGIYNAFFPSINTISPTNLSSTVKIFKILGRPDQAKEMLDYYMENREYDHDFLDFRNHAADGTNDIDVVQAFFHKLDILAQRADPAEVMLNMSEKNGWSQDDLRTLSFTPVDEYVRIFKKYQGSKLRKVISACLQFDRISPKTEYMKEISKKSEEALRIIGEESPINSLRIRRYVTSSPQDTGYQVNSDETR